MCPDWRGLIRSGLRLDVLLQGRKQNVEVKDKEVSAGHHPLPSIPNRLGCSRQGLLIWLRSLEMWSCRATATSHLFVALFQGKQLNPQKIISLCKPRSLHCTDGGKQRGSAVRIPGVLSPSNMYLKKMSNHGWPNRQMGEGEGKLMIPVRLL